jgi:hypothetical protein
VKIISDVSADTQPGKSPRRESMAAMKTLLWGTLALVESVLAFIVARPGVLNVLRIAFTRKEVLVPDWAYFAGMLFGDFLSLALAALLIWHAIRITRKLIAKPVAKLSHYRMPQKEKAEPERRHYFRVIITYSDGETSGNRVFKDRAKAERWAER